MYRRLAVAGISGLSLWFLFGWGWSAKTFYGDDAGYYWYLPSTFIYANHGAMDSLPTDPTLPPHVVWYASSMDGNGWRTPTGKVMVQYTYGVALMEAPFFLAAHGLAKIAGWNTNGFSMPYVVAIKLSTLFYAALGFLLIWPLLRRQFSINVSLAALALLLIGTNLFWFVFHQAGMAHIPLFFLYALLMRLTVRAIERPKLPAFAAMGFTIGFITLIRPTDLVCVAIPLLYGVSNGRTAWERFRFLRTHIIKIAVLACVAALPFIPQMLYWKWATGSYLYYSYGQQTFFWDNPKIVEGLFYAKNGWLFYSPLMFLALVGMIAVRKVQPWWTALVVLLPVYVYITYAWFCYNYINGFGSRPMIHIYPLLVFPLAAALRFISGRRWVWKIGALSFITGCVVLNIQWSVQQSLGILESQDGNLPFNWAILFRGRLGYNDLVTRDIAILQPDTAQLEKVATLGRQEFPDPHSDRYFRDGMDGRADDRNWIYRMGEEEWLPDTLKIRLLYTAKSFADARWLKSSGIFRCTQWPGYFKHHLDLGVRRGDKVIWQKRVQIINKIGISDRSCAHADSIFSVYHTEVEKWGPVWFYAELPNHIRDGDEITLEVWNPGHQEIYFDNLALELFRRKR